MNQERVVAIREELLAVETLPELKAIWCDWQVDAPDAAGDLECNLMLKSTLQRLQLFGPEVTEAPAVVEKSDREKLEELMAQLQELKDAKPPVQPVVRSGRKYQLLKMEVDWTSKPQVHAIMHILGAHGKPGDVLDEGDIVEMMIANEKVLETKQGGKRIWDYYKGDHHQGLAAHGNVRRMN